MLNQEAKIEAYAICSIYFIVVPIMNSLPRCF